MKIPPKIMIGEHQITIEICPDSRGTIKAGDYNSWYQSVRINADGSPEDVQAEVLLHEIIEAINSKYFLELEHYKITVLSEMLFQAIRRNKLDFINP